MSEHRPERQDEAAAVEHVIRARRTVKVLAGAPLDVATDRAAVEALVASVGWAPFHLLAAKEHRDDGALRAIEPWRCYLLDVPACRALRGWLLARGDASTFPRLLAACTALVLVTWLPDPPAAPPAEGGFAEGGSAEGGSPAPVLPPDTFVGTRQNMEHVAAAAAGVQNLLLAATARGLRTFWATGGPLRTPETFARLGIPTRELLLGAVFLFPPDTGEAEVKVSTLRERRGAPAEWSRWVAVGDEIRDGVGAEGRTPESG